MVRGWILLVLFGLLLMGPLAAWPALPLGPVEIEVSRELFGGRDTIFYCEDLDSGIVYSVQGERVEERHPPFSSFKIPNFLIALETGTVENPKEVIPYDPSARPSQQYWPSDWAQDQTLDSAFRRSAAWAFQDLAKRMGEDVYAGYLKHFQYGNQRARGDGFWLDRTLEVSPKEQVDFLRKLFTGQFEVAPTHLDELRKVALQRSQGGIQLYGKTGAGPVQSGDFGGEFEGWFVGWLERPDQEPVLFALWTRGASYQAIKDYRLEACEELLEQAGYLPLSWSGS